MDNGTDASLSRFLSGEYVVDTTDMRDLVFGNNHLGHIIEPDIGDEYITTIVKLLDLNTSTEYFVDVLHSSLTSYDRIKDLVVCSSLISDFEQKKPTIKLCFSGYV